VEDAPALKDGRVRPLERAVARVEGWLALRRVRSPAAPIAGVPASAAIPAYPAYVPTHPVPEPLVSARHRQIAAAPEDGDLVDLGIRGFLRKADALKLYEMAYCADGPIIEFGAGWGLSTVLLCEGARDGGGDQRVISVELDGGRAEAARAAVAARGLSARFDLLRADACLVARRAIRSGRRFAFAFVDHDHSYAATRDLCRLLPLLIGPGGFVLFHDFIDPRNRDDFPAFGVDRGVTETLTDAEFAFAGLFGCSALVRRRPEPPA